MQNKEKYDICCIKLLDVCSRRVMGVLAITVSYILLLSPIVLQQNLINLKYYPSSGTLEDLPDILFLYRFGVNNYYSAFISYVSIFTLLHCCLLLSKVLANKHASHIIQIYSLFAFTALLLFGLSCILVQILGYWRSAQMVSLLHFSEDMEGWTALLFTLMSIVFIAVFVAGYYVLQLINSSNKFIFSSCYFLLFAAIALIVGLGIVIVSTIFKINYTRLELSGFLPGVYLIIVSFSFIVYNFFYIAKHDSEYIRRLLYGTICIKCGYIIGSFKRCPECGTGVIPPQK